MREILMGIFGSMGFGIVMALATRAAIAAEADSWRDSKLGELIGATVRSAMEKSPDAVEDFSSRIVQPWYVKLDFFFQRHNF